MDDFEDRIKERWKERRKKAYNWQKLLLMVLVVVAIFYTMGRLQNTGNIVSQPAASVVDTLAAETELKP
ncbi:MAG: hypothetical protein CVU50_02435 [Candidatus Cloacimonetes bacterium HGW-Cloacimonetes-3]|jgi:hypothetical protein|nr:MAG: hypothetical protein CVU50_02435 [Candidatus Cloacimonetes bacterium HGW-Cloacimonetes-3]